MHSDYFVHAEYDGTIKQYAKRRPLSQLTLVLMSGHYFYIAPFNKAANYILKTIPS